MKYMRTERIRVISTARVIGILLVVLGHSYPFAVQIPNIFEQTRTFIYSFHMPLFVLISGYLAGRSEQSPGAYIANRAKKLLTPYFVLSIAAFFPKALVQKHLNDSVEISWVYFLRSELIPRANVWGHFWYIPVIFFFGVFSALMKTKLREKKRLQILVLMGSYVLLWLPETTAWFALEDMRLNLFWYVLGILLSETGILESFSENRLLLLGLPVALALFSMNITFKVLNTLLVLMTVFGIGTLWNTEKNLLWAMIDRYSFTIYLLSWPAQAVVEVILNKIVHAPVLVSMAGMFIAGIVVPLLCVEIVNMLEKSRFAGWMKLVLGM